MATLPRRHYVSDRHLSINAPLLAVLLACATFWVLVIALVSARVG
jgi:hypothetical protein